MSLLPQEVKGHEAVSTVAGSRLGSLQFIPRALTCRADGVAREVAMAGQLGLLELAAEKVIVLDGAMGTMIQRAAPATDDFRGLDGCNEILVESRPDMISEIHAAYLEAGCDVVETNTFSANGVVLAEYGIQARTEELNRVAADLARGITADFTTPDRPRYVMGSVGPGTRLPSLGHIGFQESIGRAHV